MPKKKQQEYGNESISALKGADRVRKLKEELKNEAL